MRTFGQFETLAVIAVLRRGGRVSKTEEKSVAGGVGKTSIRIFLAKCLWVESAPPPLPGRGLSMTGTPPGVPKQF